MIIFKYNVLYIFFIAILIVACSKNTTKSEDNIISNNDTIPEHPGWSLVWSDEFNGSEIDLNKWEHEVNAWGGGNNELQYYTDRPVNSYIQDSVLVIQALKETYTGTEGTREYTSARLRTMNKGDWKYGRFDIRAKLPYGQGLWPAIWLLPTDWVYGGWAASGEIDIMEMLGHETNKIYGTLHYGGEWPNNVRSGNSYTLTNGTFSGDFHVFTLEWDSTEIKWYVDDEHYLTLNNWFSSDHGFPAPFDQKFHLLLNVAVGGDWPGNPNTSTIFPQTMLVDYVRVYERE
jgi:beta-glucanase (GH16 family)